jgi:hypothetical protein
MLVTVGTRKGAGVDSGTRTIVGRTTVGRGVASGGTFIGGAGAAGLSDGNVIVRGAMGGTAIGGADGGRAGGADGVSPSSNRRNSSSQLAGPVGRDVVPRITGLLCDDRCAAVGGRGFRAALRARSAWLRFFSQFETPESARKKRTTISLIHELSCITQSYPN